MVDMDGNKSRKKCIAYDSYHAGLSVSLCLCPYNDGPLRRFPFRRFLSP